MAHTIDPTSAWLLLAWILLVIAALVGTAMVVGGMIEEVPSIVRGTMRRTTQNRRRS